MSTGGPAPAFACWLHPTSAPLETVAGNPCSDADRSRFASHWAPVIGSVKPFKADTTHEHHSRSCLHVYRPVGDPCSWLFGDDKTTDSMTAPFPEGFGFSLDKPHPLAYIASTVPLPFPACPDLALAPAKTAERLARGGPEPASTVLLFPRTVAPSASRCTQCHRRPHQPILPARPCS